MNLDKSLEIALTKKDNHLLGDSVKESFKRVVNDGSTSVGLLNDVSAMLEYKLWEFIKLGDDQQ